ncbi:MAG: PorP/SprF family type IX secretion system membrane protein [Chitinophagaceae bacterium]
MLLFVFSFQLNASAQDIHFSQFFEAPLLRNPSLAGIFTGDLRFQAVIRQQWASVTVPYQTGSFNTEFKMPVGNADDFLTMGMQFVYDKAGSTDFKTVQLLPALNYHKSLSGLKNRYLSMGFMGGYVNRSINPNKITTNSQFDGSGYNPALSTNETVINYSLGYWDGSVGMSFNTGIGNEENEINNLYVGVAFHHFNRPKNSFYRRPEIELKPKWVYSLGLRFALNDQSYFTLQSDYSKQGDYSEVIGGAMYTFSLDDIIENARYTLSAGAFMRWKDAIIPVIKMEYKPFTVALSYDINTSLLRTASQGRGGFELSITHVSFFDRYNSSKDAVRCPRF